MNVTVSAIAYFFTFLLFCLCLAAYVLGKRKKLLLVPMVIFGVLFFFSIVADAKVTEEGFWTATDAYNAEQEEAMNSADTAQAYRQEDQSEFNLENAAYEKSLLDAMPWNRQDIGLKTGGNLALIEGVMRDVDLNIIRYAHATDGAFDSGATFQALLDDPGAYLGKYCYVEVDYLGQAYCEDPDLIAAFPQVKDYVLCYAEGSFAGSDGYRIMFLDYDTEENQSRTMEKSDRKKMNHSSGIFVGSYENEGILYYAFICP